MSIRQALLAALLSAAFSGLASAAEPQSRDDLASLDFEAGSVSNFSGGGLEETEEDLRLTALRDAALSTGAQHGYVAKLEGMKEQLRGNADYLSQIWDFSLVMRLATRGDESLYLLPPIIREVDEAKVTSADRQRLRVSDRTYQIRRRERLVLSPPNWRDYLLFDRNPEVSLPPEPLLPDTDEERRIWESAIDRGWQAGERQAVREMTRRFERLGTDYIGMLRYMRLLASGQIEAPFVSSERKWVVGGGDEMRINEKRYEISRPASLNPDAESWEGFSSEARDGYRYPEELRDLEASPGYGGEAQ